MLKKDLQVPHNTTEGGGYQSFCKTEDLSFHQWGNWELGKPQLLRVKEQILFLWQCEDDKNWQLCVRTVELKPHGSPSPTTKHRCGRAVFIIPSQNSSFIYFYPVGVPILRKLRKLPVASHLNWSIYQIRSIRIHTWTRLTVTSSWHQTQRNLPRALIIFGLPLAFSCLWSMHPTISQSTATMTRPLICRIAGFGCMDFPLILVAVGVFVFTFGAEGSGCWYTISLEPFRKFGVGEPQTLLAGLGRFLYTFFPYFWNTRIKI